jgi:hypothetical protein
MGDSEWMVVVSTGGSQVVRYGSREDTERVAMFARRSRSETVVEGPRPLNDWEKLTPLEREGIRRAAGETTAAAE